MIFFKQLYFSIESAKLIRMQIMQNTMARTLSGLALAIFFLAGSAGAQAGLKEGVAAYQKGNYAIALKELRPLADNGDVKAQTLLGEIYDSGKGVPQDHKEAASWFHKTAAQGDAGAQTYLAVMYERGIGIPQNDREAASWYRKAAEQGSAEAQFTLGGKYKAGQGIPTDLVQAHKWLNLAAAAGIEIALQDVEEVEARMSR